MSTQTLNKKQKVWKSQLQKNSKYSQSLLIICRMRGFIILLMEIEVESSRQEGPFDIIYNARSTRASRSRKSSVHTLERDKPMPKFKKLRKMTLNPESIRYNEIRQLEDNNKEHKGPASQRGEIKEQEFNIDDYFDLGYPQPKEEPEEECPVLKLENKSSAHFKELTEELMGLELSK